jgi:gluconolactonase
MSVCKTFCLLAFVIAFAACQTNNTTESNTKDAPAAKPDTVIRKVVILDTEALHIIDSTAPVEVIASGYKWTEGPLYVKDGGYLLFSDIPNNTINKWQEVSGASVYLTPSGHTGTKIIRKEPGSNGLSLDTKGNLVLCQHGDRRIARMDAPLGRPAPKFVTLADKYNGKRLNSPNDGVFAANGDFYFTDPPYGLDERLNDTAKQLDFQGVYRLKPNGQLDLFTKELKLPNGIALSPDGKILYVSNSDLLNMIWMRYVLDDKGLIKGNSIFYRAKEYEGTDAGNPDGMKVNKQGYIFGAGPQGIWIFNPAGKVLARIYTGAKTANCAFSIDEKTLFIAGSTNILRVRLK